MTDGPSRGRRSFWRTTTVLVAPTALGARAAPHVVSLQATSTERLETHGPLQPAWRAPRARRTRVRVRRVGARADGRARGVPRDVLARARQPVARGRLLGDR